MKWPEDYINQIICNNCLEVMKKMPDNCIDTIITDPPYGIGFMGKEWDVFKSDFVRKSVEKSNRNTIKKDGMASKSAIRYDESLLGHQKYQDWCVEWMKECLRIAKPGTTFLCCGSPRVYHHIALATERAGWIIKDCIMWLYGSGFPKASDISKQIDKRAGVERIDLGKHPNARKTCGNINICKKNGSGRLTAPATPEATLWNGWKSHGLKPAYEPILVAMKPNEGSYANNALKWKVAGLNIDGGRIPHQSEKDRLLATPQGKVVRNNFAPGKGLKGRETDRPDTLKGRYPANVILDEEAGRLLDEQSGVSKSPTGTCKSIITESNRWKDRKGIATPGHKVVWQGKGDTGGASRFFYCAKASKAERNRGCEGLPIRQTKGGGGMNNTPDDVCGKYGSIKVSGHNHHPTVKPLALMKYLCTLTNTPTGGIVLDPFCGSGTTLMACKELKRDYIGIDNIPEYCEIARRRVNAVAELLF